MQENTININSSVTSQNTQVLSDTMRLLSYTLVFGGLMSWMGMATMATHGMALAASIMALVIIWFVLPKTQNGPSGIPTAFAISGLLGYSIGPILNHYMSTASGMDIVLQALMGTGIAFFGISYYAKTTKKDFSFLNGIVFFGIIGIIVLSLVNYFIVESGIMSLAISYAVVMLMGAYLLAQMSQIINGGERNYVAATIGLYIGLHNMFVALLHIIGMSDD